MSYMYSSDDDVDDWGHPEKWDEKVQEFVILFFSTSETIQDKQTLKEMWM